MYYVFFGSGFIRLLGVVIIVIQSSGDYLTSMILLLVFYIRILFEHNSVLSGPFTIKLVAVGERKFFEFLI